MRVAVAGAGQMGETHLRTFQRNPGTQVVAIADLDLGRGHELASRYDVKQVYSCWEDLLAQTDVDVVDIVLPHHLHAPVAEASLRIGRDVISEKPLALCLEDADRLIDLADKHQCRLLIKSYQRYARLNRRLKKALDLGQLGRPYLATGTFASDRLRALQDPADWHGDWQRCGGGVLADAGYHLIDLYHYFFGNVKAVTAQTSQVVPAAPGKAEAVVCVILEFFSGVLATVVSTWADTSLPLRFERQIFGTSGSASIIDEGVDSRLTMASDHEVRESVKHSRWWQDTNEAALDEIIADLTTGRPSAADPGGARHTLQTVAGAYESARTGIRIQL